MGPLTLYICVCCVLTVYVCLCVSLSVCMSVLFIHHNAGSQRITETDYDDGIGVVATGGWGAWQQLP